MAGPTPPPPPPASRNTNDLLSRQVELTERMNVLLEQQYERLAALEQKLGGQAAMTREATSAIEEHNSAAQDANSSLEDMSNAAAKSGSSFSGISDIFGNFSSKMREFLGDGIFNSFSNGIQLLGINFDSLANIVSNPVSAAMGFLGSLWDTLVKKAAEVYREMLQLAEAMEKIREKFGSFNENTSRRTLTAFENLGSTLKTTTANSAAFGRKFAPGFEGAQQRLDKVLGIAEDLSPVIDLLGQQFNDAADQMYLLKEGLNFSGEALKQTAVLSQLSGKSLKQFSNEIMTSINKIGKQFGVSTKVLGQDVGKALSNFKLLGRMTGDYVKEMTKAAVFTRKLGIEINELTGLIDKFDEFEGGAEAAATLAQGFGMVLDPLKMMGMEVGPRLQELQRAFMATGRSIESMSRQERKLLADTAGLSEEQALLAFSAKGMSMSYDEIAAGADSATKKQKSMDDIINDVLDNIPNVIVGMKNAFGFIEAFIEGIGVGFGGEMLPTLIEIAKELGKTFGIGIRVGKQFFEILFPKDADGKSRPMLDAIVGVAKGFTAIFGIIEDFVTVWNSMPAGADVSDLIAKTIGGIFTTIETTAGNFLQNVNFGEVIAKIGKFFVELALGIVKWATGPNGISSIATQLRNAFKPKGDGKDAGSSIFTGLKDSMLTLIEELPKLIPLLGDLALALLEMLGNMFTEFPIAELFLAGGPVLMMIGDIINQFFGFFGNMFGDPAAAAGVDTSKVEGQMQVGVGQGITNAATTVVEGAKGFMETLGNILLDAAKVATMAGSIALAIGLVGEAVHNVLIMFVEPQGGRDKSFVQLFADASAAFATIDSGSIATVGVLLGGIVAAIGVLVAGLMYAVTQIPGGATAIEAIIRVLGTAAVAGSLIYLIKEFGRSLADIVIEVAGSFASSTLIDNIKKMEGVKFDWLPKMVEGLVSVFNAVPKIMELVDTGVLDFTGSDVSDIVDAFKDANKLLIGEEGNAELGGGIVGIMKDLAEDERLKGMFANSFLLGQTLSKISESMTSIGSIVSSLTGMGDIDDAIKNAAELSKPGGLISQVKAVAENLLAFPDIGAAAEATKKLSEAVTNVSALSVTLAALKDLADVSNNVLLLTGVAGGGEGLMKLFGTLGLWFNSSFGGGNAISSSVIANVSNMKSSVDMVSQMNEGLENISEFADNVEDITSRLTEAKMREFEGTLIRVVEHVRMINTALQDLDRVNINATIDKLGTNMRVARESLKIAGGAVNVNVQLNMTINAEKISQALVLGGYVAPTQEYRNELQTDYKDNNRFDGINETTRESLASTALSGIKSPP